MPPDRDIRARSVYVRTIGGAPDAVQFSRGVMAAVVELEPLVAPSTPVSGVEGDFHACAVTSDAAATKLDWSFIDAAYCISLKEREDRTAQATTTFNAVGLAPQLLFYRPTRHTTDTVAGIWQSHSAVARHALAAGHRRIAIFEDDVRFDREVTPPKLAAVARELGDLPRDWQIFYLGHWPVRCRLLSSNLLHTRSGCTHAYIANRGLLEWMRTSDYAEFRRKHPKRSVVGRGIDSAFFRLPKAYAIYPMLAIQNASPSDHRPAHEARRIKKFRHLVTRTRLRERALSLFMRPNELKAVSLAALWALVMRLFWNDGTGL